MSLKRKLKKQRKRRAQWTLNLEDLYLRQADDAFLEAARPHLQELDAASMAGVYDEVAGRALAGALTGGDPARVGELLTLVRRDAAPRPLVLLAEAVDLLAQGRREPAAARLAALGEADEAALGVARRLPERLRVLADSDGVPPADPGADGEDSAVWHFYRALAAVRRRSFRPGKKTLAALTRAIAAIRSEGRLDRPGSRLLAETEKRLRALVAVRELEQALRRRRGRGAKIEDLLLQRLGSAGLSNRLLDDDPPALLRPLRHALRTRWRDVLELVLERRGATGLARLLAARPEVLAADLDGGARVAEARRWVEAKALLESQSFAELAAFLRSAGARAESSGRLAALWSLELWARQSDTEEDDLDQAHLTLVRLIEMASAVGRRFVAVERSQVARFLRDQLLELCDVLYVCGHFQDAAEALLEHLGDDPGLLAVALTGAVSSRDDRARREHTARIAARGPARTDQDSLLRVAGNLAAERPAITVPVLTALKPLFTDGGWSAALDRVAPEAMDGMRGGLVEAFDEDPEEVAWIRRQVRRDLELYRPLLDGRPELAALDLAVDCWGAAPSAAKLGAVSFLSRFESLEAALVLYRQAFELSAAGVYPEVDAAVVETVIDRLDARWSLWMEHLMPLAIDATAKQVRKLRKRIRGFLKDANLEEDDRLALGHILDFIGKIRKARRLASILPDDLELPGREPSEEPEPKPRKPRVRRPRPVDDRQMDLF